jgi:hypothetical protein
MSFWRIFDRFAVTDKGGIINKVSEGTYVSSDGKVFTQTGSVISGSDGSLFSIIDGSGMDERNTIGQMAIKTSTGFGDEDDKW